MNQQSTGKEQTYYEAEGDTVRERLLDALKIDLLGPETPDEALFQSPASRYLIGMLAPRGTRLLPSEDEGAASTVDEDDDQESGPRVAQQLVPSSIGLSFIVASNCDSVDVRASWGEYKKEEIAGGPAVEPEDAADINTDDDPNTTATTKHKTYKWRRTAFGETKKLSLSQRTGNAEVSPGASLEWLIDTLNGRRVVSVFLVNTRTAPDDRRPADEDWMYQPELSITGDGPVFFPR